MATVATNPSEEPVFRRPDPWRIAWDVLVGDGWLASVLLAIALLLALSAWLPQAPDSATDPVGFSRWRSDAQVRFGNTFALLRETGLFTLDHSAVLRGLIALVALCLIVRTIDSVQAAWRARRFQPPPALAAPEATTERLLEDITAVLQRQRFRIVREGDTLRADRFVLADVGRLVVYLGALIVIGSLMLSNLTDWRASGLTLGVGQMVPINAQHGTSYSLRLDALDSATRGQVTLLRETDEIGTGYLAPDRPLDLAGLTISISGDGPAIRASATLTDGQPVLLQAAANTAPTTELLLLLTRDEPDRFFAVPEVGVGLVVRLSRGESLDAVRAQVYRSRTGEVLFDNIVPPDGQVSVENVILHFRTERYVVLALTRDPSRSMMLAGMTVLALGLMLATFWPRRQLWAIGSSNGTRLIGDADAVQAIASSANSIPRRVRVSRAIASIGWRLALAILSVVTGTLILSSLMRGRPLWLEASAAPAFVAAWLASCAAIVWTRRVSRWVALVMAIVALAAVAIQPGMGLPLRF
jgi:hypothetical protein